MYKAFVSKGFIGLGKLGLPLSTIFAKNGVSVLGIDTDKELIKMNNKKNEYEVELANIDSKLNNPSFLNKAPSDIIDQFKNKQLNQNLLLKKFNKSLIL